jgi:hypothetical protein
LAILCNPQPLIIGDFLLDKAEKCNIIDYVALRKAVTSIVLSGGDVR